MKEELDGHLFIIFMLFWALQSASILWVICKAELSSNRLAFNVRVILWCPAVTSSLKIAKFIFLTFTHKDWKLKQSVIIQKTSNLLFCNNWNGKFTSANGLQIWVVGSLQLCKALDSLTALRSCVFCKKSMTLVHRLQSLCVKVWSLLPNALYCW